MTTINHCPVSDIPATALPHVLFALHERIRNARELIERQIAKRERGEALWVEFEQTPNGVKRIPRFYYVADWRYVCPHAVIADAEKRIKELSCA